MTNHTIKDILRSDFVKRCKVNPKYSLRAYANYLEVENSWLSKVFRGQKNPSPKSLEHLGKKLGLPIEEIEKLKGDHVNRLKTLQRSDFYQLQEDIFNVISDWYHLTILELMKLDDIEINPKVISASLGISIHEAFDALERLQRVGLISKTEDGKKYIDTSKGFTTHNLGPNYTSVANRKYQKQIIELSLQALEMRPITERDHSSMTMASSKQKMFQAKKMIDKFRYKLCEYLEDTTQKDVVYQLSVALFPLTHDTKESGSHE